MLYEARDSVTNRVKASPGSGSNTISSSSISHTQRGGVVEDADEVPGLAAGGLGNLMAAARAIGGEQGIASCHAHLRQHAELTDLQRYLVVLGLIAERSCHATACRVEALYRKIGNELQSLDRRADRGKRFLVTMP